MEGPDGEEAQVTFIQNIEVALEREEYLDVVVDAQQRKFLTEMRGGTNLLGWRWVVEG